MTTATGARGGGFAIAFLLVAAGLGAADGTVTGRVRFERVTGSPELGYLELYETDLFLSPDGGAFRGPSFRVGAPPGKAPRGDGYYSFTVPEGPATLYLSQPLFFISPRVVAGITVPAGRALRQDIDLSVEYATYFTDEWTPWSDTWAQTFVATGSAISSVSWKLAGTDAAQVQASVLVDDGTPNPLRWPLASPRARKRDRVSARADNWVRWRSDEVATVPGKTYAVRLDGIGGGFAVFSRPKDARSYSLGSAWSKGGARQGFDLNVTVFGERDGAAVLLAKTTEGLGDLRDGYFDRRWGQSFRATRGRSLAAVDVWAAGADRQWDLDFTFRVRESGPTGRRIGPAKTTRAAFQAFGAGLHAASWAPGEVPLTPGGTYYVELENPVGFNPYVLDDPADAYPDGAAYQSGVLKAGGSVDLSMTIVVWTGGGGRIEGGTREAGSGRALSGVTVKIVELGRQTTSGADGRFELGGVPAGSWSVEATRAGYRRALRRDVEVREGEPASVELELEPLPCSAHFQNGGFEQGIAGWTTYGDARARTIDGKWFGDIRAAEGSSFQGNEINGCCLEGGLWQRTCARAGHRYRVTARSNIYWIAGSSLDATSRLGVDPGGGTDAGAASVIWSRQDRQGREATEGWRQLSLTVEATGPIATVFLDFAQRPAEGNPWRINCFDDVRIEDLDRDVDFVRGDCDQSARRDISDAIYLLNWLFLGGPLPGCDDACDTNDDGSRDLSDASWLLNWLFLGGTPPAEPGGDCGADPTADALGCGNASC